MHTCVVGQSNPFRAALTLLLEDTEFTVATSVDTLAEVSWMNGPFRRDQRVFLVQKPDDLSQLPRQIEMLKARHFPAWIVFLARTFDATEMADSFACGVDGYLLQEISPRALIKSLNLVTLGVKVFPSQIVTLMVASHLRSANADEPKVACNGVLSGREAEVVNWLMLGTPNKVIAWKMSITESTVKVHVKTILKKVGFSSRTQLAVWAVREGLQGKNRDQRILNLARAS